MTRNSATQHWLIFSAWLSMLAVSDLPDVLVNALTGQVPQWLFYAKVGFLTIFLAVCWLSEKLRPLKPYALLMLVFSLALTVSDLVRISTWWQGLVTENEPSFFIGNLRPYVRDTGVTLVVLLALWLLKRRRSDFFLVRGQLDAPIEPVRWLGIGQGESWRTFGWIFALSATLAVAIPTLLGVNFSPDWFARVLPAIPAVLFFAALNAFNEEIYFRATLLSTLPEVIGRKQALLINIVFFGLAHYLYGSPPGVLGFLMAGFLAYLLGKSMLETKGLSWPWLIHFLPDVVVFFSYAVAWGQP